MAEVESLFFSTRDDFPWNGPQTTGPIGTNFGSHLRIHLGMDIG